MGMLTSFVRLHLAKPTVFEQGEAATSEASIHAATCGSDYLTI